MTTKASIRFFFQNVSVSLSQREKLKDFIRLIFTKEKKSLLSLNYVFCSDKALLEMNRLWLDHDFYTDIITFDLSEDKKHIKAEVYISADRVKENAKLLKISHQQEFLRVIFHGSLHLCGYSDKSRAAQLKMRKAEDKYLKLYRRST